MYLRTNLKHSVFRVYKDTTIRKFRNTENKRFFKISFKFLCVIYFIPKNLTYLKKKLLFSDRFH